LPRKLAAGSLSTAEIYAATGDAGISEPTLRRAKGIAPPTGTASSRALAERPAAGSRFVQPRGAAFKGRDVPALVDWLWEGGGWLSFLQRVDTNRGSLA
jgi:hypothetical protein